MFSPAEYNRYNRQIILPEIGPAGQQKLKEARVLVIGAGGLGCPILQYLAAAGVGTIGIADYDVVSESNLHRQVLFTAEEVGQPKAEVAARKLKLQNPFVQFVVHGQGITVQNALELVQAYDLVVDGSDNFPTRYLVNDACALLQKPLVFGSIFKFEGQVTVFHYLNGPSYRCLFPEPPGKDEVPNCAEIGVLGVLPGIIGTIQANEAIKIICQIGTKLSGRLFMLNALTMETSAFNFRRTDQAEVRQLLSDYEAFCSPATTTPAAEINEISADELKDMLDEEIDFQLLDVREPHEYEQYNIEGVLLPLSELEQHFSQIEPQKTIVVHCKTGSRSRQAIQLLQQHFPGTTFYNLTGGIDGYPY
ncbi:molybdopterin-synthase adenylyltransferase MoeB [Pontibacter sp. SGAir0037]|uniref:molybdopterin-synthase adenylyltransferase MoeB n=1 Tax=Pontibacter sp. SGAir0037 TaxID=2571030 RepID=UPI0010CD4171|nr:molybdopterin-synthase adenylyltransferase MoeB [Pontibacter sp. SGAir0037]QCR24538.1 molybdenum cofactor biosynthesis protein MoeB [Pontibacter sp. SGAir0037]